MQYIDKDAIRIIHAQLATLAPLMALKMDDADMKQYKRRLVEGHSNGRCDSTKAMYSHEGEALRKELQTAINKAKAGNAGKKVRSDEEVQANNKRRRIIAICHDMHWELPDGKVDMKHVNDFCVKRGYLHKPLNDYTATELSTLILQFEKVYESLLKSV